MLEVFTVINLVAAGNDELPVGIKLSCGFNNARIGFIVACTLRLRVAQIEEGKAVVAARCSFNNSRFAPPAAFCVAYAVAVFCAGSKPAELDSVLNIFL